MNIECCILAVFFYVVRSTVLGTANYVAI